MYLFFHFESFVLTSVAKIIFMTLVWKIFVEKAPEKLLFSTQIPYQMPRKMRSIDITFILYP